MDKYVQENLNNPNHDLDSSSNTLKKRLTSKDDLYEAVEKNWLLYSHIIIIIVIHDTISKFVFI